MKKLFLPGLVKVLFLLLVLLILIKLYLKILIHISRVVLEKGLDSGTAFEILSIDIADIDIGKNIGAVLQMDQANADKNIAQAKAEERRAMAVAVEQEMKAKAQEAEPMLFRLKLRFL